MKISASLQLQLFIIKKYQQKAYDLLSLQEEVILNRQYETAILYRFRCNTGPCFGI